MILNNLKVRERTLTCLHLSCTRGVKKLDVSNPALIIFNVEYKQANWIIDS